MRLAATFLLICLFAQPCPGWWDGGHHLISVMAYELLNEIEQQQLQALLANHPRFADDFVVPPNLVGSEQTRLWIIGRAGYWPDVARSQPEFNRPSWHYQLGASLTIGAVDNVPRSPGPVPDDATLATQELHIAQAVELCRKVLANKSRPDADRALAICWLSHLAADSHQPCHAGSLYINYAFPNGDRGATAIPTKQAGNLHALWDSLLGPEFDAGDVRRRAREIKSDASTWADAITAASHPDGANPLTWLEESAEYSRRFVYAPEVRSVVEAASRGKQPLEMLDLSEEYLTSAGQLARVRAAFAAHRLARILHEGLSQ